MKTNPRSARLPARSLSKVVHLAIPVLAACALLGAHPLRAQSPDDAVLKGALLDVLKTHSGPYASQAKVVLELVRAGDLKDAAWVARTLEVFWDRGELMFDVANPKRWKDIDKSMDEFVEPIVHHFTRGEKAPEVAALEAAYNKYVEQLKWLDIMYRH